MVVAIAFSVAFVVFYILAGIEYRRWEDAGSPMDTAIGTPWINMGLFICAAGTAMSWAAMLVITIVVTYARPRRNRTQPTGSTP